jgi:hypothetical protein
MVARFKPKVGYKMPPEYSKFEKGRSGNPRGRPRRVGITVETMMAEELQCKVLVTENGRRQRIPKLQLLFKQAVNMAIAGNFRALAIATRLMDTLARFYQAPTRFNQGHGSLVGVDLTKLSTQELQKMYHELIVSTGNTGR